jgi:hypothetical protein
MSCSARDTSRRGAREIEEDERIDDDTVTTMGAPCLHPHSCDGLNGANQVTTSIVGTPPREYEPRQGCSERTRVSLASYVLLLRLELEWQSNSLVFFHFEPEPVEMFHQSHGDVRSKHAQ